MKNAESDVRGEVGVNWLVLCRVKSESSSVAFLEADFSVAFLEADFCAAFLEADFSVAFLEADLVRSDENGSKQRLECSGFSDRILFNPTKATSRNAAQGW